MEHQLIKHTKVGREFEGIYYLEGVQQKTARNGNIYADLVIRDKSGRAFARYWNPVKKAKSGCYIAVHASVEEYMDEPRIIIAAFEVVPKPDDMSNLIIHAKDHDSDLAAFGKFEEQLKALAGKVSDDTCVAVYNGVFEDEKYVNAFAGAPCSLEPHYGRVGGLLNCTVRTTAIALDVSEHYGFTPFERYVLLASGLMCKVGAVLSFEFDGCFVKETERGVLLGTGPLSLKMIAAVAHSAKGVKQGTVLRMTHAIAAANDTTKAMTKEAIVLAEAYRLDATMVHASDFIAQDLNVSDVFTAWDSQTRRRYYKGLK